MMISMLQNHFIVSVEVPTMHCSNYCVDPTLEGLKMTQAESKHVALRMYYSIITYVTLLCFD
jgi:hypothetical protein